MKKIILITILFLFLSFLIYNTCQAVDLLLKYPTIKGTSPTSEGLPGFIKYIYLFSLGASGFIALLMMLIGAVMYIFSAGNPSKAADAKDRIFSALLGIFILLVAVLALRIINPDLVNIGFKLPPIIQTSNSDSGISGESEPIYKCSIIIRKKNGDFCFNKEGLWCKTKEKCKSECDKLIQDTKTSSINQYTCGEGFTVDGACTISTSCK